MQPFRPLFRQPTWHKAQILLMGAILTTDHRTVTACLRVMGLSDESALAKYHHVLNRAICSSRRASEKLLDWAGQMIYQLRCWLPTRSVIVVGDNTYAALDLLHACQTMPNPVTMITGLRLDAALYEPAPAYAGVGRPRQKGAWLPALQTVLTSPNTCWRRVKVKWYDGQPRRMELTFQTPSGTIWANRSFLMKFYKDSLAGSGRWLLARMAKYGPSAA